MTLETNVDWNWLSFLAGVAVTILIMVVTGFLGEVGKDLWAFVKPKILPKEPLPKKVDSNFVAPGYPDDSCLWVNEDKLQTRLDDGYSHYLDPTDDAPVYRIAHYGDDRKVVEYLLVRPAFIKSAETD